MTALPAERFVRLAASMRREIGRVAQVVEEARLALDELDGREPPDRDLRGAGSIVHDYYTGIERVFEKIAPELNGGLPAGAAWHRHLLEDMTLELPGVRPVVLQEPTARRLDEYLRFRHLFRNRYGFELEWTRLRPLLERLPSSWQAVHQDLVRFLGFLDRLASAAPS